MRHVHPFWASQSRFVSFKTSISELNIRSSSTVYSTPNMDVPLESENRGKGQMISLVLLRTATRFEK